MNVAQLPEGADDRATPDRDPQEVRGASAPMVTRAALGEPHYLPGAVFLPVVIVLDVRGGAS